MEDNCLGGFWRAELLVVLSLLTMSDNGLDYRVRR